MVEWTDIRDFKITLTGAMFRTLHTKNKDSVTGLEVEETPARKNSCDDLQGQVKNDEAEESTYRRPPQCVRLAR